MYPNTFPHVHGKKIIENYTLFYYTIKVIVYKLKE